MSLESLVGLLSSAAGGGNNNTAGASRPNWREQPFRYAGYNNTHCYTNQQVSDNASLLAARLMDNCGGAVPASLTSLSSAVQQSPPLPIHPLSLPSTSLGDEDTDVELECQQHFRFDQKGNLVPIRRPKKHTVSTPSVVSSVSSAASSVTSSSSVVPSVPSEPGLRDVITELRRLSLRVETVSTEVSDLRSDCWEVADNATTNMSACAEIMGEMSTDMSVSDKICEWQKNLRAQADTRKKLLLARFAEDVYSETNTSVLSKTVLIGSSGNPPNSVDNPVQIEDAVMTTPTKKRKVNKVKSPEVKAPE